MSEYVRTQAELRASLEFTQNEVTELKKQLSNVNITPTQMSSLVAGLQKLSGTVDYLENQSRRSNLRIDGIAEIPGETWAQTEAVRAKLAKELNKITICCNSPRCSANKIPFAVIRRAALRISFCAVIRIRNVLVIIRRAAQLIVSAYLFT